VKTCATDPRFTAERGLKAKKSGKDWIRVTCFRSFLFAFHFFRFPSLLVARKLHDVALRHTSYLFRLLFTVCHSSTHFRFFSLFSTTLKGLLYKYGLITIAALEISVATERVGVSRCRAYSKRVFRTNCALRIKKCAPRIYSGIYFLSTS